MKYLIVSKNYHQKTSSGLRKQCTFRLLTLLKRTAAVVVGKNVTYYSRIVATRAAGGISIRYTDQRSGNLSSEYLLKLDSSEYQDPG